MKNVITQSQSWNLLSLLVSWRNDNGWIRGPLYGPRGPPQLRRRADSPGRMMGRPPQPRQQVLTLLSSSAAQRLPRPPMPSDCTVGCINCGRVHDVGACVARGKICRNCLKLNHFAMCCCSQSQRKYQRGHQCTRKDAKSTNAVSPSCNFVALSVGRKRTRSLKDTGAHYSLL